MTTQTVKLNKKTLRLSATDVIGMGGEAAIFQHQNMALKVYLAPDASRAAKLQAMLPRVQSLPPNVIAPQELLYDTKNKSVIGFTMSRLDANFTEVRSLSNKKFRAQTGIHATDVMRLFLNAHQTLRAIHTAGMVVGDFNDLNLMFHDDQLVFIDVDSFQFDRFPCMVGTESFLDPALYNHDLAQAPQFTPENDWYAFAVLLFKSLLLTHPYGGTHPIVHTLPHRAQQRLTVFDSSVTYPRIAYSPDLLSDDLAHIFDAWFAHGQRGQFPEHTLHDYLNHATTCPNCSATYPTNRGRCPMCSTVVPVATVSSSAVHIETLLQTHGDIIAWHLWGNTVRVLSHENGKVIYHSIQHGQSTPHNLTLFNTLPQARYGFLGDVLVISPANNSTDLMLLDTSGDTPQAITQTTTETYSGTTPMFSTSQRHLYRIAGNYLMRGHIEYGQLVEQSVLSISQGQTYFVANPHGDEVFGFFRVFNDYQHWLLVNGQHLDADLTPLANGESLTDISVKFAKGRVLVQRLTRHNGIDHLHTDEIDHSGKRIGHLLQTVTPNTPPPNSIAYMGGVTVAATDAGIVQTRLDTQHTKTFPQTEPVVKHGDSLHPYQRGLLAVHDNRVRYITL